MPHANPVLIPLLNPNEPEALLVSLHVKGGQSVLSGDLICTLETTKSATDLPAESSGFVVGLRLTPGQIVRAGDILCYLADSPDWTPPDAGPKPGATDESSLLPEGLRITQPALTLAQRHNLDLGQFRASVLVTEKMVQESLSQSASHPLNPPTGAFDPTAIIVYGGGGHGKSLIDMLRGLGTYRIIGVVDDGIPAGASILGCPVLGGAETLPGLFDQGVRLAVNAVGGIGNLSTRLKVFDKLAEAGFVCPAVVHLRAFIEPSARLMPGVQIFAQAYVGSEAQVGFGVIINTGAIISHDCVIGDYANISPGAILAGEVWVGEGVLVGMGVTVNLQVKLGRVARIGNSATVKSDVPEHGIVRAGSIWPT